MKAQDGVADQRHVPSALRPGKFSVTSKQKSECAPGPVGTSAQILAPSPPPGFDPRVGQLIATHTRNKVQFYW